ncbi:hypothetical protein [Jannaschia aquimarina]|uniref:Uncharacterized protein n=1 Tax=Jannaschia aquimarina TaxID=935700 RepID=A0A0D1EL74_9RHOB|nr:hypothetical protein [Jannaschia aquimarina]KIT16510.1 hypothetical protein jaqu_17380 [Jannaschia aquimarina]SNT06839.1 hypothetical protein SAMN05421775_105107 [Jannaschia aquimarina]
MSKATTPFAGTVRCVPVCLLALLGMPAWAQVVGDCDTWQANARNVAWSDNRDDVTRTFGNGAIRLTLLDTEEPALAAFHILVTYPDPDAISLECRLVSAGGGLGFPSLSLSRAFGTYDPARGLTVEVPGLTDEGDALLVTFTINRATGEVTIP